MKNPDSKDVRMSFSFASTIVVCALLVISIIALLLLKGRSRNESADSDTSQLQTPSAGKPKSALQVDPEPTMGEPSITGPKKDEDIPLSGKSVEDLSYLAKNTARRELHKIISKQGGLAGLEFIRQRLSSPDGSDTFQTRLENMIQKAALPTRIVNGQKTGKGIFWFTTTDNIALEKPAKILEPIWTVGHINRQHERHSLLEI